MISAAGKLVRKIIIFGGLTTVAAAVVASLFFPQLIPNAAAYLGYEPKIITHETSTPTVEIKEEKPFIIDYPTQLVIPALNMTLPVKEGLYNQTDKSWNLSLDSVHYAHVTAQPNNYAGRTFIYGHARKGVFLKLPDIKSGDKAYILTKSGFKFIYEFTQTKVTNPEDTSIFHYDGPPILTLQTCIGTWWQNRQLFTFDFVSVEKQ